MRPRNRILAAALGAFTLAAAASCSGGSSTQAGGGGDAPKEVTLWVMNNGPDPVNDTKKLLKPFEDKSGIKVNVELVAWEIQQDKIRNAAVAGGGPDVTQAGTTQVPNF